MLMQRRPPSGIWGGLWSLPEVEALDDIAPWLLRTGLSAAGKPSSAARFRHTFSHYHLDIDVQAINIAVSDAVVLESEERVWYNGVQFPGGVAAPVSKILDKLVGELL